MLRNTHESRCFLWRQNDPEINYSPTRISVGGVFLEEVSRKRKRDIVQDRERWRALVGTVRNLRVPKVREIS
jgi:hypothetical protein